MPKITAFLPEYFLNKRRRGHARAAALILRYPPSLSVAATEIHSTPFRCAQNDKERQTARPQPGKNFIKASREK